MSRRYEIQLPTYKMPLFQDIPYDVHFDTHRSKSIALKTGMFSNTNYYTDILRVVDDNIYLTIKNPLSETCKTVIVQRELDSNNQLSMRVSYYGLLSREHLNALASTANRFGCDTLLVNQDCMAAVLA